MKRRVYFGLILCFALFVCTLVLTACDLGEQPAIPGDTATLEQTETEAPEQPEHVHEFGEWVVIKEPTCTEDGCTVNTCTVCGHEETTNIVTAPGHSYEAVVTAPDCVNGGYTTYTCTVCGDSYVDDQIAANGHNYVGEETKAPTCGAVGEMTYTCTACGDSYTEEIAATGAHEYFYPCDQYCMNCYELTNPDATHTVVHVEAVAPTCTALGNIEYWYCDVCGQAWLDEACTLNTNMMAVKLPMAEHTYFDDCSAICEVCGYEREAGHNVIHVEAKDATCTELGNIEYWTCEHCGGCWDNENATGMPLNRMMVIVPATGEHAYDHAYDTDCNVCNAIRTVEQPIVFGGNSVSDGAASSVRKSSVSCAGDNSGFTGKMTHKSYSFHIPTNGIRRPQFGGVC